tara:strand:- start:1965 stop:3296 length:1332 start_codon:yes stop_codon:yes gene_type:complete
MQKVSTSFIILAAGIGSRMKSSKPKVLHEIANTSIINYLLKKIFNLKAKLNINNIIVVLGHENQLVKKNIKLYFPDVVFAIQKNQLGTADAVYSARDIIGKKTDKIIVLCGDAPLVSSNLLIKLTKESISSDIGVVGFRTKNPSGYGRIVKDKYNNIDKIIEHKDTNSSDKKINFCNSGILICRTNFLMHFVKTVSFNKNKKEKYLTDIVKIGKNKNKKIILIEASENECIGINDREDLAMVERELQENLRKKAMKKGVTLIAPETVFFSYDTVIAKDVIIGPNVVFGPKVKIETGVVIEAFSHLEGVTIKKGAKIGPFARIRPGVVVEEDVKIGNFVEVKKSRIKKGAKINHLSYVGDSNVGKKSNIGAGVITCNYDGKNKNKTIVEDNAFIGSNVSLVAPVKVGKNSKIGAGSVITKNVLHDSLAVERNKQINIKKKSRKT